MAHGPRDLNALYKRMREVTAYLREDAAALEALVGEPVMLRMVKSAGRGRKSPQKSPQGTEASELSVVAREGIEPPTRGFSARINVLGPVEEDQAAISSRERTSFSSQRWRGSPARVASATSRCPTGQGIRATAWGNALARRPTFPEPLLLLLVL